MDVPARRATCTFESPNVRGSFLLGYVDHRAGSAGRHGKVVTYGCECRALSLVGINHSRDILSIAPEGLPLGILPKVEFEEQTVPLENVSVLNVAYRWVN